MGKVVVEIHGSGGGGGFLVVPAGLRIWGAVMVPTIQALTKITNLV